MSHKKGTGASPSQPPVNTTAVEISSLRRKRGNIIGQITAFHNFLESIKDSTQIDTFLIESHLNGLNMYWERFEHVQFDLEGLDPMELERRLGIQNNYYAVIARANKIIQESRSTAQTATVHHPTASDSRAANNSPALTVTAPIAIKLPEMRLPTFDGSIEKWSTFYELFSSIIDRSEDLTPVQKMHYLRSVLTGKAAASIASLRTTDADYIDAIEILKSKYDNTRKIILKHCNAIWEYPKLVKDSAESLGDLVDAMNQNLRSLNNMGEPIASWNSILVSIILSKVSASTVWHWELSLKDKKMPKYTDLLAFLEKRADCVPAAAPKLASGTGNGSKGSAGQPRTNKQGQSQRNAFLTVKGSECPACKDLHGTWSCDTFRALSLKDRLAMVARASLCSNCLGQGRAVKDCKFGPCRVCHKKHHTLLHKPGASRNEANGGSTVADASNATGPSEEDRPLSPK